MTPPVTVLAWLLVAVPLGTGAALVVAGVAGSAGVARSAGGRAVPRRGPRHPCLVDRAAPAVALVSATACLGLACAVAVGRPTVTAPLFAGIPVVLAVDGLSAVMVVTVTAVTLVVAAYSAADFGPEEARARFFGLLLLFAGAMLMTVTAATLAVLLMAWEVMGAASYALIGYWWRQPRRVTAGTTAFLTTRAADLGLYLAAGAALAGAVPAGAVSAVTDGSALATGAGALGFDRLPATASPWLGLVAAGVAVAALGKSAQLPFSFWLSRAMEGPSPVSALLHSATMVAAGAYLLLRLHPVLAASGWVAPAVASVGAATAVLLGLVAIAQRDLKQVLAASTCAQIGFMVMAAGAGGLAGGMMQLVAHAAVKSLLFLAAGAWLTALGTKRLDALHGVGRRWPVVGATFATGAFALAGLPPLSLWVAKDAALAAVAARWPVLYGVGFAAAVISAVYAVRSAVVVLAAPPPPASPADATATATATGAGAVEAFEQVGTGRVTPGRWMPLVTLAVPAAALGVLGLPPVASAFGDIVGEPDAPSPPLWGLAASGLAAGAASAAVWWWGARRSRLPPAKALRPKALRPKALPAGPMAFAGWMGLADWLRLEAASRAMIIRPTLTLARVLARFDDRVLGAGVTALGGVGGRTARRIDRGIEARIGAAVGGLAGAVRRLGRLARRPQTGMLHQYYAQAMVALVLLALAAMIMATL